MSDKQYIGDGVYVEHDGYQMWLTTERENGTDRIAMEGNVFYGLVTYAANVMGWRVNSEKDEPDAD